MVFGFAFTIACISRALAGSCDVRLNVTSLETVVVMVEDAGELRDMILARGRERASERAR